MHRESHDPYVLNATTDSKLQVLRPRMRLRMRNDPEVAGNQVDIEATLPKYPN